ncbi:MAG TPA: histidine kinase dimerization/phospho-acceptor domain-containing protein, partial [Longimicrobiales bacterium]|nr:histidine kinase dimerization/phospho-acceptor domain-containing protein [Longimicrobiales bacterium]
MDLPPALRLPSRSSITLRLTVLFAGTTFGILLLSAAVLYWSLARSLRAEDARLLRENATLLQQASRHRQERSSTVRDEILLEPAAGRLEPFYARIVDRDGRALVETPGMADILPASRFAAAGPADVASWRSPAGRTFLILSRPLDQGARERLQVALDVTHDAHILTRYRRVLVAVLALATLLATLVGLLVARRGLAPIDEITKTVRRITAHRLDRRIGGRRWPEELADLARVFDQMLGRLEESFARLSRFGADLAHELRTPLTNLRGEAEVALGRARTPGEYRQVLESSLEEHGRLTELIDRLLFLARAESGA